MSSKKTIEPEVKKEITTEIIQEYSVSIARACRLIKDDYEVSVAIKDASELGDGFWKIFARIRRSGKNWNHKKVYRVYKSMCYNSLRRLSG